MCVCVCVCVCLCVCVCECVCVRACVRAHGSRYDRDVAIERGLAICHRIMYGCESSGVKVCVVELFCFRKRRSLSESHCKSLIHYFCRDLSFFLSLSLFRLIPHFYVVEVVRI